MYSPVMIVLIGRCMLIITNAMQTIGYFTPCPGSCCCNGEGEPNVPYSRVLLIDCCRTTRNSSSLLKEINQLLSHRPNLNALTLVNTTLEQVPIAVCNMSSLAALSLSRNRLTSLPRNCFQIARGLVRFYATENKITRLDDGVFSGRQHLRE